VIIISHRLGSLKHANEILFLEKGHILERGTHEELIARGGRYHDLWELQIRPAEQFHARYDGTRLRHDSVSNGEASLDSGSNGQALHAQGADRRGS
jgi:ABC-type multidrug transport system ATPase subunit